VKTIKRLIEKEKKGKISKSRSKEDDGTTMWMDGITRR